jgi:mono/diheme cytochrome c family protein
MDISSPSQGKTITKMLLGSIHTKSKNKINGENDMNTILKRILGGILLLFAALVIIASIMVFIGISRVNKTYHIQPAPVSLPDDEASLAIGEKWADTLCTNCHREDYGGQTLIDDESIGLYIASPNITPGNGGIGANYTNESWVLALRHGIRPDGTPLLGMPSNAFYYMSDEDLGALIAYLKTVPPIDNHLDESYLTPVSYLLTSLGVFKTFIPAEVIQHDKRPPSPIPGLTAEYGLYLVRVGDCANCHGDALSGGQSPVPGSPPGPNLTPGGAVAFWSEEEFITTMRTGETPYGGQLDADYMPWNEYQNLSDDELSAILLYLQSLPSLETNQKP